MVAVGDANGHRERDRDCGRLPAVRRLDQARGSLEEAEDAAPWVEALGNYTSYVENATLADAELEGEMAKGFLEWSPSKEELESRHRMIIPSRMAALIKSKIRTTKVRLIHDLRRSGVNAMARVPGRIVPPRLRDAIDSAIGVAKGLQEHEIIEFVVLDFKDAFKHLPVRVEERRFHSGQATVNGTPGYFVYKTVLFGAIAGPLVWGRLAALLMRCTAGALEDRRAALQCYVDDPFMVLRHLLGQDGDLRLIVLLWASLGFKLSWAKGAKGHSVDWIGAKLQFVFAQGRVVAVEVSINGDRAATLQLTVAALLREQHVDRREVKTFAGLCSWVGSIIPAMRPYTQMLWAAACAAPSGSEARGRLCAARIELLLKWIASFAAAGMIRVTRRFPLDPPEVGPVITFDASLSGGGATLQVGDGPTWWLATRWTDADRRALNTSHNNAADQPVWEAFALVIAVSTWSTLLQEAEGKLHVRGDAKGVLQSMVFGKSKAPQVNLISAEAQLILGRSMHALTAAHDWSEENQVCDVLSRLHEGAQCPVSLSPEHRRNPVRKTPWTILGQRR